jgi:hypothetical protein
MIRKLILILVAVLVAGFLLLQLAPYGRAHDNPPVAAEPVWDSPQTFQLAQRACYDCHSNETVWPWYSHVAPVSWLVQRDVDEGRHKLNFSLWGQGGGEVVDEMYEVVADGEMPPAIYLVTHPEARLTEAEKTALAEGLAATTAASPTPGDSTTEDHEEDTHMEEEGGE